MSPGAECKNGNSAIDSYLVISLGTLSITKFCHNQPLFITYVLREMIQTQCSDYWRWEMNFQYFILSTFYSIVFYLHVLWNV